MNWQTKYLTSHSPINIICSSNSNSFSQSVITKVSKAWQAASPQPLVALTECLLIYAAGMSTASKNASIYCIPCKWRSPTDRQQTTDDRRQTTDDRRCMSIDRTNGWRTAACISFTFFRFVWLFIHRAETVLCLFDCLSQQHVNVPGILMAFRHYPFATLCIVFDMHFYSWFFWYYNIIIIHIIEVFIRILCYLYLADSIQICLATLAQYFNTNLQILSLDNSCNSMRLCHLSKGAEHTASACNTKPQGARESERGRGKVALLHMNSLPLPHRKCVFPTLCCRFCAFIMHVVVRTREFGFSHKRGTGCACQGMWFGF